jgi:hypothetical protein
VKPRQEQSRERLLCSEVDVETRPPVIDYRMPPTAIRRPSPFATAMYLLVATLVFAALIVAGFATLHRMMFQLD